MEDQLSSLEEQLKKTSSDLLHEQEKHKKYIKSHAKQKREFLSREEEVTALEQALGEFKKRASSSSGGSSKIAFEDLYSKLVGDAMAAYDAKIESLKPKPVVVKKQKLAPSQAPSQALTIVQQNQDPQYLTKRIVQFDKGSWFYDQTVPPNPSNPKWAKVTDAEAIRAYSSLGTVDATGSFVLDAKSVAVSFNYNSHSYSCWVEAMPTSSGRAGAADSSDDEVDEDAWKLDVQFTGKFFVFNAAKQYFENFITLYDFDTQDKVVHGSQLIADLATQFSSVSYGAKYDVPKCQAWYKPAFTRLWLMNAKQRGFTECRVCMHGNKDGSYHLLSQDITGFNMNFSGQGAHKWGAYLSGSDHLAWDKRYNNLNKYPAGSGCIGLLLIKPDCPNCLKGYGCYNNKDPKMAHEGAYHHYNMPVDDGHKRSEVNGKLNAYALRDQMLWLPLGLAVAKK